MVQPRDGLSKALRYPRPAFWSSSAAGAEQRACEKAVVSSCPDESMNLSRLCMRIPGVLNCKVSRLSEQTCEWVAGTSWGKKKASRGTAGRVRGQGARGARAPRSSSAAAPPRGACTRIPAANIRLEPNSPFGHFWSKGKCERHVMSVFQTHLLIKSNQKANSFQLTF